RELFWRIAMQPGKPCWGGVAGGAAICALPGNPLSVLAGFELIARPALARMQGREPVPTRLRLRLATAIPRSRDRTAALPVQTDGGVARWPDAGGSPQLARAAASDGLVLIDPGEGRVEARAEVDVAPFAGP